MESPAPQDFFYFSPFFPELFFVYTATFQILTPSLLWFFIGYWILKRGWVSTRPLFFSASPIDPFHSIPFPESVNPKTCYSLPNNYYLLHLTFYLLPATCADPSATCAGCPATCADPSATCAGCPATCADPSALFLPRFPQMS